MLLIAYGLFVLETTVSVDETATGREEERTDQRLGLNAVDESKKGGMDASTKQSLTTP